ncbi:hypothetical protein J7E88_29225 [Streptomyces sp. ISL-10]|uniref:hypothetical protein n=1 Tax=Streptomyces sp. ISL-10 TaxID=2819172 RepID=UPI001BE93A55|nr:hypothetical protein [Streptomyces sp. ISL-10]MBT2369285.1 hypothetical protein [Streptomyces sp. ISL-10]
MIKTKRGVMMLAAGLLAATGGLAAAGPSASAAPAATIYPNCPTSGSEWIGYTDRGQAHASCSGADVRVQVTCANGRKYDATPYWTPNYAHADCPRGVGATAMYTSYRM